MLDKRINTMKRFDLLPQKVARRKRIISFSNTYKSLKCIRFLFEKMNKLLSKQLNGIEARINTKGRLRRQHKYIPQMIVTQRLLKIPFENGAYNLRCSMIRLLDSKCFIKENNIKRRGEFFTQPKGFEI